MKNTIHEDPKRSVLQDIYPSIHLSHVRRDIEYIIPQMSSGSTMGTLPNWTCPEDLQREALGTFFW